MTLLFAKSYKMMPFIWAASRSGSSLTTTPTVSATPASTSAYTVTMHSGQASRHVRESKILQGKMLFYTAVRVNTLDGWYMYTVWTSVIWFLYQTFINLSSWSIIFDFFPSPCHLTYSAQRSCSDRIRIMCSAIAAPRPLVFPRENCPFS